MLPLSRMTATLSVLLLMAMCSFAALAQEDDQKAASPLRLSYVAGEVSFSRYGAEDWVEARLNTPLAAGDALYVGRDSDLELQMGSRAFVRADDDTQLTLVNQTADFVQFRVTSGRVSFDLRTLPAGYSVEVDTPNAVFTIDRTGYYRVDVDGDVHFITRRGGRAIMVPAGGQAMSIHPSEEIVVKGSTVARAETYVAPELDRWDRWNYDRTDGLVDAVSERYLPSGIAGAYDLDHYGRWRVVAEYGPVWVPDAVAPGWAPYSTGRWVWDPYYQWTWIDDAPWGWAPFHYGRWVYLSGYWAWAPGPVVRHAVYAPALVAFFGIGLHVSVGIGIGGSGVGWVALSWGEPLTPWWGRPSFIGRPWWGGWGGPRVVNNVVIKRTTVVNVSNINYYNTRVSNAVVATTRERFGTGHVHDAPVRVTRPRELAPVRGALPVKPGPASLAAGARKGIRPPESVLSRPVMATRPPGESMLGAGVAQALGAKVAAPGRPVVCITGDGAFGFHPQEIETAVRCELPIVVLVTVDRAWGMVKVNQEFALDAQRLMEQGGLPDEERINTDLGEIRYDLMAESMGALGIRVSHAGELRGALEQARDSGRPTVVHVDVDRTAHKFAPSLLTFKEMHQEPAG